MVLASDGIWDVLNSNEVVGFIIRESDDIRKSAQQLVITARTIWDYNNNQRKQQYLKSMFNKGTAKKEVESKPGAIDDITAIVIVFNPRQDKSQLLNI